MQAHLHFHLKSYDLNHILSDLQFCFHHIFLLFQNCCHIRHIREKIEINPKEPRYLKVVWGVGYKVEKIG